MSTKRCRECRDGEKSISATVYVTGSRYSGNGRPIPYKGYLCDEHLESIQEEDTAISKIIQVSEGGKPKVLKINKAAAPFSPSDRFEVRQGDERFGEDSRDWFVTDHDYPIARCSTKTYANLLGTAPELLAALKMIIQKHHRCQLTLDQLNPVTHLIAKAEGRA